MSRLHPTRSFQRGVLTVVGLFLFGGVILGGLYLAPHPIAPPAPSGIPFGIPNQRLKFICYDLRRLSADNDGALQEIQRLAPDYLLLQQVQEQDVVPIAAALGMQQSYHPALYQRAQNLGGRKAAWGSCVLSRHPLFEGHSLNGPDGIIGVVAIAVVQDREFLIGCATVSEGVVSAQELNSIHAAIQVRGNPPTVLGGNLGLDGKGAPGDPVISLNDVRSGIGQGNRIAISQGWRIASSGVITVSEYDGAGVWAELESAAQQP